MAGRWERAWEMGLVGGASIDAPPMRMSPRWALKRALEHMAGHEGVWFATREEIADHWAQA